MEAEYFCLATVYTAIAKVARSRATILAGHRPRLRVAGKSPPVLVYAIRCKIYDGLFGARDSSLCRLPGLEL